MNWRARTALTSAWLIVRAALRSVQVHWGLACLSLVAAFGIWFLVQDVENPRTRANVPGDGEQQINVEALNVPDGYLVTDPPPVRVEVQARQSDIGKLHAGDFRATVDVHSLFPGGSGSVPTSDSASLKVTVDSKVDGVRVLNVLPATVPVTVVKAETKEFRVEIQATGALPEGYTLVSAPTSDPPFVTITGLPSLVDSVARVNIPVSLSGIKDETFTYEGDLIALTASGNPVTVSLSQSRARVTIKTQQTFSVQTVPLVASVVGSPAPGFRVSNVQVDPPVATISGPKVLLANLGQLQVEKVDVSNASANVTQTRQIERPPNVSLDRTTVTIKVEIKPIDCGTQTQPTACGQATIAVAPTFDPPPAGLAVEPGAYTVMVRISGPIDKLSSLKLSDFKVTVSLAGATAGTQTLPTTATGPQGVKIEGVDPITLRLIQVTGP